MTGAPGVTGPDRPLRLGCVMEQVLGHVSWSQQLRRVLAGRTDVQTRFVETTLYREGGLPERVPGLPFYVRGGLRALLDVRQGLRGWRPDVLLFNTQKPAIFCQADLLRTPSLLMTDVTPRQYDEMARRYEHAADAGPVTQVKHAANVLNFRLAAALVPWSTWTARSLVQDYGADPARVHVIPPGVDTSWWVPAQDKEPREKPRLLFVGGNFERKGGRLLLDVFRRLSLHERAELHVVTRDPVDPTPGVTVHHNVQNNTPEILRLYQQADAFVLPTLADCFSIASIEAMAAGLPVITTNVGGIPDIVEDGRTGFLVPPEDGRALATALARLVSDATLRAEMGARARARAETAFDAAVSAQKLVQLARAVLATRTVPASRPALQAA